MKRTTFNYQPKQAGFTIVELMIATLVFSVILTVITSGVLHFTTDYYRGINASTTQGAAAKIINNLTQAIQFTAIGDGGDLSPLTTADGKYNYICTTKQEYVYSLGALDSAASGLYVVNLNGDSCTDDQTTLGGWSKRQDLLQPHMRLVSLTADGSGAGAWNVSAAVAFGDADLLCDVSQNTNQGGCLSNDPVFTETGDGNITDYITSHQDNIAQNLRCKSQSGSQFCNVVALTTTVQARLGD